MSTFRGVARIPAVTIGICCGAVLGLTLVACGSDDESSDPTPTAAAVHVHGPEIFTFVADEAGLLLVLNVE